MQTRFSIKPCRSGSLCLLWLVCLMMIATNAIAADQENRFYDDTRHGWFWYEDPPPTQDASEDKPKPTSKPPRNIPSLDNYSIDQL